jgi:Fe-S cluster biosynthesis and repair protein YggX
MLKRFFNRGKKDDEPQDEQGKGQAQPAQPQPPPPPATPPVSSAAIPMDQIGQRMVMCAKLKQRLPGLDRPPFTSELGQRIYDNISAQAWELWKRQAVMLVNHYGLIGVDPDARKWLNEQMEAFLFEDEEQMPEGWAPEDQGGAGAKGAPAAKGAPSAKGAPAAQRK